MFSSVAYGWTFYYLLALVASAREMTRHRIAAARVIAAATVTPTPRGTTRSPRWSRRAASGLA
jgi:hypothetical protein